MIMTNVESKLDALARMVKLGFDRVEERFTGIDTQLQSLGRGQEEIKLRLDSKVDRFELREIDRRVTRLEKES